MGLKRWSIDEDITPSVSDEDISPSVSIDEDITPSRSVTLDGWLIGELMNMRVCCNIVDIQQQTIETTKQQNNKTTKQQNNKTTNNRSCGTIINMIG
tara:strand:+ start:402 stop:692 length:291 start_codon:yes stop_codon:yes gene_type:complete